MRVAIFRIFNTYTYLQYLQIPGRYGEDTARYLHEMTTSYLQINQLVYGYLHKICASICKYVHVSVGIVQYVCAMRRK
jgi:hypothetical protein